MKKAIKKIPLLFWAIFLSFIAFQVVKENFLPNFSTEQTRILSGLLTFIGLIFVAINIQKQWKNERIKTEYLNQPDFSVQGFASEKLEGSTPTLCGDTQTCIEDHWFDLKQTGNLAAIDLKVGLFYLSEAEINVNISNRWLTEKRLGKDDTFQYKLPLYKIPFTYFDKSNKMCFLLLLEYRSEYSGIKYKRIYQLCSVAKSIKDLKGKDLKDNDWKDRITFYNSSLISTTDTDSICFKHIIKNWWFKFTRYLHIKKDYTYDEWLIDI